MEIAQKVSSMILGLRRKVNIKVRQPLSKIMIPVSDSEFESKFEAVKSLILSEVNVKEVEYIKDTAGILVKKIKPNFKLLGPKYGKLMKEISTVVQQLSQEDINNFESSGTFGIKVGSESIMLTMEDVEINSEDIPGWLVANDGKLTAALDVTLTGELLEEGIAREFVNRIQNLRKESGFEVTDKIDIEIQKHEAIDSSVTNFKDYICSQTLAKSIKLVEKVNPEEAKSVELDDNIKTFIKIGKI